MQQFSTSHQNIGYWVTECFTPRTETRYFRNSWRDWPWLMHHVLTQKTNMFNMCYTDASISSWLMGHWLLLTWDA